MTAAPAATSAPAQPAATTAAPATQAPSKANGSAADYMKADRKDTLSLDIDGGRVIDPTNWNPYNPDSRRDIGFHQAMMEPLFILNYSTGKIDPWLGGNGLPPVFGQDAAKKSIDKPNFQSIMLCRQATVYCLHLEKTL